MNIYKYIYIFLGGSKFLQIYILYIFAKMSPVLRLFAIKMNISIYIYIFLGDSKFLQIYILYIFAKILNPPEIYKYI